VSVLDFRADTGDVAMAPKKLLFYHKST